MVLLFLLACLLVFHCDRLPSMSITNKHAYRKRVPCCLAMPMLRRLLMLRYFEWRSFSFIIGSRVSVLAWLTTAIFWA